MASTSAQNMPHAQVTPLSPSNGSASKNILKRKASKPILTWISRRLGSSGRKVIPPPQGTANSGAHGTSSTAKAIQQKQQVTNTSRAKPKAPPTSPGAVKTPTDAAPSPRGRKISALRVVPPEQVPQNTIILNDSSTDISHPDSRNSSSSPAPGSTWSPSNPLEADDDASIRPLPPTSPPSPAPSRSSSSYLSDPRTFRSGAASTKPTTLLSFDSGHGSYGGVIGPMAHIAQVTGPSSQAAPTPGTVFPTHSSSHSHTHSRTSSSLSPPRTTLQAPLHTTHHPRNNPHPASPPPDNASVLTLASSAYASPNGQSGVSGRGAGSADWTSIDGQSMLNASGLSMMSGAYEARRDRNGDVNSSQLDIGEDGTLEGGEDGDAEASVRALRPRSSRRGSWESGESRWSARIGGGVSGTGAAPSLGNVSLTSGAVARSGSWTGRQTPGQGGSEIVRGTSEKRSKSGLGNEVDLANEQGSEHTSDVADGPAVEASPSEIGGKPEWEDEHIPQPPATNVAQPPTPFVIPPTPLPESSVGAELSTPPASTPLPLPNTEVTPQRRAPGNVSDADTQTLGSSEGGTLELERQGTMK